MPCAAVTDAFVQDLTFLASRKRLLEDFLVHILKFPEVAVSADTCDFLCPPNVRARLDIGGSDKMSIASSVCVEVLDHIRIQTCIYIGRRFLV